MWVYEKKLQYPVRVSKCDPHMAKLLMEQYGGADGELAAALRYLNQRYTIPDKVIGVLNDIGTEEFAHLEMIATMIYKLTKDASVEQMKAAGLGEYYAAHDHALYYQSAGGVPLQRPIFKPRVIQLRICMRILRQKKRRELHISG